MHPQEALAPSNTTRYPSQQSIPFFGDRIGLGCHLWHPGEHIFWFMVANKHLMFLFPSLYALPSLFLLHTLLRLKLLHWIISHRLQETCIRLVVMGGQSQGSNQPLEACNTSVKKLSTISAISNAHPHEKVTPAPPCP